MLEGLPAGKQPAVKGLNSQVLPEHRNKTETIILRLIPCYNLYIYRNFYFTEQAPTITKPARTEQLTPNWGFASTDLEVFYKW